MVKRTTGVGQYSPRHRLRYRVRSEHRPGEKKSQGTSKFTFPRSFLSNSRDSEPKNWLKYHPFGAKASKASKQIGMKHRNLIFPGYELSPSSPEPSFHPLRKSSEKGRRFTLLNPSIRKKNASRWFLSQTRSPKSRHANRRANKPGSGAASDELSQDRIELTE